MKSTGQEQPLNLHHDNSTDLIRELLVTIF